MSGYQPRGGRGGSHRGGSRGGRGGATRGGRGGRGGGGYHGAPMSHDADAFFAGTSNGAGSSAADSSLFPLGFHDTSSFQLPPKQTHQAHHAPHASYAKKPPRVANPASRPSGSARAASHLAAGAESSDDGFGSDLLGDDDDRTELALMDPSQREAVLLQRADVRKQKLLRRAQAKLEQVAAAVGVGAGASTSSSSSVAPTAKLSSGKSFKAAKPAKGANANPQARAQSIAFRDDLAADAMMASDSADDSLESDEYDDGELYNDEDTIFDMQEQAMLDGRQQQAAKQAQQSQPKQKHTVVTKRALQQQQQPQQSHAESDGLTHSQRRTLRREQKKEQLSADVAERLHGLRNKQQQQQHASHIAQARPPAQAQAYAAASPAPHGKQQPQYAANKSKAAPQTPQRNNAAPGASGSHGNSSTPHRGGGNSRNLFPEHLSAGVLDAGVRNGVYLRGTLRIVGNNAFVSVAGLRNDVFIEGRRNRNRGFDGDEVVVQIIGSDTGAGTKQQHNNNAAAGNGKNAHGSSGSNGSSSSKQAHQATLEASLANLILDSERKEEAKMEQEALGASAPKKAQSKAGEEEEEGPSPSATATPASLALLAKLSSSGPDVQHRGVVLGISHARFPQVHAPGTLKPFADHIALFVPLDRKTPFALLPERAWPAGFAEKYKKYLSEQKEAKEAKLKAMRARKEQGSYPLSAQNSSDVVVEQEEAAQRRRNQAGGDADAEEGEVDAMSAATDPAAAVLDPHIYVAAFQAWQPWERQPFCTIQTNLGLAGTIVSETEALLVSNGIDYDFDGKFGKDVLDEVASYTATSAGASGWTIPAEEVARRRDFRDQTQWRIVSIDPTTARDLDDAIHVRDLGGDVVEVGVHIADVSHFVRPGTRLDAEARHRATTVYLVNKALPMLPPILCEQLCSLNPNQDRLAYSTVFYLSKSSGKLLDSRKPWFGRSVIRTCCRLNYESAQLLMELDVSAQRQAGRPVLESDLTGELAEAMAAGSVYRPVDVVSLDQLVGDMQLLHAVSMRRRADRFATGSLTLSNVKLQFVTDAERNPTAFYTYVIRDSNRVVEECMLLANYCVARETAQFCRSLALMRRHPPPQEKSMERVSQACAELGFDIDASTAGTLQRSLDAYEGMLVGATHAVNDVSVTPGTVPIRQVLEPLCTRPMQLAAYCCAGSIDDPAEWRHYALNFDYYTHFTSPIRRYADIIVHRVLTLSLEIEAWRAKHAGPDGALASGAAASRPRPPPSLTADEVVAISEQCNTRKAAAKKAQEQSSKVYLCAFLEKFHADVPLSSSAVITDMTATEGHADPTFNVMMPAMGLEKTVHIADLLKHNKVAAAHIEPRDPARPNEGGGKDKHNNQQKNKAQAKGASSSSSSSVGAAPATAPSLKSDKRLHIEWLDGSSNTYKIFESISVELVVRHGPPVDIDAFVISPQVAADRDEWRRARDQKDGHVAEGSPAPINPPLREQDKLAEVIDSSPE